MELPIDVISNTNPPKFKWKQKLSTPIGVRVVDHQGPLHVTVEGAVVALVNLTKRLLGENNRLLQELQEQADNIPPEQPTLEEAVKPSKRSRK